MVNRNIRLFLIPMPFCTFVLLDFCPFFWVLLHAFLFEFFFIQAPLSIVSFCVRDVFNFQLMDREELWQFCTHMIQYFILIHIALLGDFDSYFPFGFQFLARDHLYIIYCLRCFLSMGLLLSPPRTFFSVRWMEPQNSILDLLILTYFTRIKQDFNVFIIHSNNLLVLKNP